MAILIGSPAAADCSLFGLETLELGLKFASREDPWFVDGGGEARVTFDVEAGAAVNVELSRNADAGLAEAALLIADSFARLGSPAGDSGCRIAIESSPFTLEETAGAFVKATSTDPNAAVCATRERWRAWIRESQALFGSADVGLMLDAEGKIQNVVVSNPSGTRTVAAVYYGLGAADRSYDVPEPDMAASVALSAFVQSVAGGFAAASEADECAMTMRVHPQQLDMEIDDRVRPIPPLDVFQTGDCGGLPERLEGGAQFFPRGAAVNGQSGWAVASYNVALDGSISDIEIVDHAPNDRFARAARDALEGSRYPPLEDGRARTGCVQTYMLLP